MLSIVESFSLDDLRSIPDKVTALTKDVELPTPQELQKKFDLPDMSNLKNSNASDLFDRLPDSEGGQRVGGIFTKTIDPNGQEKYAIFRMGKEVKLGGVGFEKDNHGDLWFRTPVGSKHIDNVAPYSDVGDRLKYLANDAVDYSAHNPGKAAAIGGLGLAATYGLSRMATLRRAKHH